MVFNDARAPGQGQAGGVGREVAFEAVDEGVHVGQVVGPDRRDPLGEPFSLQLGEYLPEGTDMPGEGVQLGAVGQNGLELQSLPLRKGVWVGENPPSHSSGRRRPSLRRGIPEGTKVGADGTVSARVSVALDLLPEGPGILAALGPPLGQVQLELVELRSAVLPLSLKEFFRGCRVGQALNGSVGRPEFAGNRPPTVSFAEHSVHDGVFLADSIGEAVSSRPR
ncbi:hypothetical protein ACIQVA_39100 [Streptomyces microflavus]|uniref:hypothetical protein n=1 Tax=Streptomyces microflavus TaxID=1919 RepID=UPI0037F30851